VVGVALMARPYAGLDFFASPIGGYYASQPQSNVYFNAGFLGVASLNLYTGPT
jgi:hypothetical protein